jgi:dolichol-phosphate mannosyltransferase
MASGPLTPFEGGLSIVVPAYNEVASVADVALDALRVGRTLVDAVEVLIVDDGSRDGTAALVDALARDEPAIRVVRHDVNRGLTATLRTGFASATLAWVTWLPADGQIPASALTRFAAAHGTEDLLLGVYAARPDPLARRVMSKTLRHLLRLTSGFRLRLEGPYLFRRELLQRMALRATRGPGSVGYELAMKIQRLGGRIAEVEVSCVPRRSGSSKVANWRNVRDMVLELWSIRRSLREG